MRAGEDALPAWSQEFQNTTRIFQEQSGNLLIALFYKYTKPGNPDDMVVTKEVLERIMANESADKMKKEFAHAPLIGKSDVSKFNKQLKQVFKEDPTSKVRGPNDAYDIKKRIPGRTDRPDVVYGYRMNPAFNPEASLSGRVKI